MRQILLVILLVGLIPFDLLAQTNSDLSGNFPNDSLTKYEFNFFGNDIDNCIGSHIHSLDQNISISMSGNGRINLDQHTEGDQGWYGTRFFFVNGNCSGVNIDLSNNDSIYIVFDSDVDVPNLNVYYLDSDGIATDSIPVSMPVTAGPNIFSVGNFPKVDFQGNPVNYEEIASVILQFRNEWNQPIPVGFYSIDKILIGQGGPDTTITNIISGSVYNDISQNCQKDSLDESIDRGYIYATPGPYYSVIDSLGGYNLQVGQGVYSVNYILNKSDEGNVISYCTQNNSKQVDFSNVTDTIAGDVNFAMEIPICHNLNVSISSNRRRRCFKNSTQIHYGNTGFEIAHNAKLYVQLPEYLRLVSSSVPWDSSSNSMYIYEVGDVLPGQSSVINLVDSVICWDESIRGATQCYESWITPTSNCVPLNPLYNGEEIKIVNECTDSSLILTLVNQGTGGMIDSSEFRIFRDAVLAYRSNFLLQKGDSLNIELDAEGSTIRIEADQSIFYPGDLSVNRTVENCGAHLDSLTFGFYTLLPTDYSVPYHRVDCLPISDSYDPNDISVSPEGILFNHIVAPEVPLKYKIRFQNTGSDTAYNIIIIDTLDTSLNLSSIKLGEFSHNYQLEIEGGQQKILKFIFSDVYLPHQAIDDPGSNGYFTYTISPYDTIALGTEIFNKAHIYFDYNSAIITNEVLTTIDIYTPPLINDLSYLIINNDTVSKNGVPTTVVTTLFGRDNNSIVAYPNPIQDVIMLKSNDQNATIKLITLDGKVVLSSTLEEKRKLLNVSNIPSGFYLLKVETERGESVFKVSKY